ncbi:MAG: type 4a pilus biogenesis protein PilO [Planctomycetota bacterium]|jgi:Tfp pilus assembly protein PilO
MQLQKNRQVVIFSMIVVMTSAFVCFRYLPLNKKMKAVENLRQENQVLISRASIESQRFLELQEELQKLKKKVENYDTQIPAERDLGGFLQKITSLMDEHRLTEQNVQPGKEINIEDLTCIPVSMKCKGRTGQIFEFYKSLQKLDRAIRIECVELINDEDLNGEVTMNTHASVYYAAQVSQEG